MKMFAWELRGKGLGRGRGKEGRKKGAGTFDKWPLLAKDVQVDWCGLAQSVKDLVDLLDVEPLLRFSLPAAQHDVVNLLGADSRSFQNSALGNALNDLKERKRRITQHHLGSFWTMSCPGYFLAIEGMGMLRSPEVHRSSVLICVSEMIVLQGEVCLQKQS